MTQEDKELLLKDLCARLPYGVKCYAYQYKIDGNDCECCGILTGINNGYFYLSDRVSVNGGKTYDERYLEVKPYLRPMSSMTEEECDMVEEILEDKCIFDFMNNGDIVLKQGQFSQDKLAKLYDYYNSIHVDYRGLIPMGLAIEAPKGMYNI